jgi:hypothetical protein
LWSSAIIQMVVISITIDAMPNTTCISFGLRQVCSFAGIRQKFKNHSSMWTMYFRLTVQRRTIFSGSVSMNRNKFDISM